jgi:hypothetical protein
MARRICRHERLPDEDLKQPLDGQDDVVVRRCSPEPSGGKFDRLQDLPSENKNVLARIRQDTLG